MTMIDTPDVPFTAHDFPILGQTFYANHAAISPWPRVTADAVSRFAQQNARHGPQGYAKWLQLETRLREVAALMLNAPSADAISLLSNTTEGIGIVANGLPWQTGDNIVTALDEFPTNRLAWEALASSGVELRMVDIRSAENPEVSLGERIDRNTRLLTVSSVQWNDGFRLDLDRLGKICSDADVYFFVDAIQQFCTLPIDVQRSRIHFLSAGSHKWQMGPEGMGVFYMAPSVREQIRLNRYGWRMRDRPYRFDLDPQPISDSGRRFEPGSPNTMGQIALLASLELLNALDGEILGRYILDNTRRLMDAIGALPGLALISRQDTERRSGIVSFQPTGVSARQFNRRLKKLNVEAAVRGEYIRLSPHFYQSGETLDTLLNALEAAVRGQGI